MPRSLFWSRTDTAGAEHAVLDDGAGPGFAAHGTQLAVDPIPYTCRYRLATDADGGTTSLAVEVEGAGWSRTVRLERGADGWRVKTGEQGDLDAALRAAGRPPTGLPGIEDTDRLHDALDVDLDGSALFNTLPIRRLGLAGAASSTAHRITVAWVLVPSLEVVAGEQVYTALGPGRVGFASDTFRAELTVDDTGLVRHYPGLADLS
ncbi:putative glycolipid-binding domain-containing protein [Micromonospora sp. WMMD987]|uniref:putative glycolipid-binding domain-containing protein n=1 Tax=Micromonospora sp. WMMD987 TaxID=3016089 RepID=UPI00249B79C8|nr:putative glycolipid-binding domain-containing protein [Micromonospora sp. WMMD987]WFE95868.1 putative glycolipid-binding domain-containing protein [Micromonospora sp. WMMD987]